MDTDVQQRAALAANDSVLASNIRRKLIGVQRVEIENVLAEILCAHRRRQDSVLRASGVDAVRRLARGEAGRQNEANQRGCTSNHALSRVIARELRSCRYARTLRACKRTV